MPGLNKRISAKAFVTDLRAGMDDRALMLKHQLSENGLGRVLDRLVQAGILQESEIRDLKNSQEAQRDQLFECPACKKWHVEAFTECPHCGVVLAKFELIQADESDSQQSLSSGVVPEATIQDPAKLLDHLVPIRETQDKTDLPPNYVPLVKLEV
jgi:ribosomal protein L37AE/L43A